MEKEIIVVKEMKPKKVFNFKEYYDSNPEYRLRHLAKSNEQIVCTCGRSVCRSGLAKHKTSKLHLKLLNADNIVKKESITDNKYDMLLIEIEKLKQIIHEKIK